MNEKSYLCKYIAEFGEDALEKLKREKGLKVKREGDLAIFTYNINCDFFDPIVREARGIIIDLATLSVVCWPFTKFGNHGEPYADDIDWQSARVLEKVDGSIVKLWYDKSLEKWQFSTNGMIRAEESDVMDHPGLSFMMLIRRAENFSKIDYGILDKDTTYIFELVSPEGQVVISYEHSLLYHIGTRSNITGLEREEDIGIIKPRSYALGSLEECLWAAAELNIGSEQIIGEGFVVVDKDYNRVKIKSLDYITKHRTSTVQSMSKERAIDLLLRDRETVEKIYRESPAYIPVLKFYEYQLAELRWGAEMIGRLAVNLYEEYSHNRAAVAKVISQHPLARIGFFAIETGKSGGEILDELSVIRILGWIKDYEPIYNIDASGK